MTDQNKSKPVPINDRIQKLELLGRKLDKMLEKNMISQAEYDKKKQEIVKRMSFYKEKIANNLTAEKATETMNIASEKAQVFASHAGKKLKEVKSIATEKLQQASVNTSERATQNNDGELKLWKPSTTANWSLLLTPIFSTWLHEKNWQALGQVKQAKITKTWFYISIAYYLVAILFFPPVLTFILSPFFLATWYFLNAKKQIKHVKEHDIEYKKMPWGKPLLTAFGALVGFIIVLAILGALFGGGSRTSEDRLARRIADIVAVEITSEIAEKGDTEELRNFERIAGSKLNDLLFLCAKQKISGMDTQLVAKSLANFELEEKTNVPKDERDEASSIVAVSLMWSASKCALSELEIRAQKTLNIN